MYLSNLVDKPTCLKILNTFLRVVLSVSFFLICRGVFSAESKSKDVHNIQIEFEKNSSQQKTIYASAEYDYETDIVYQVARRYEYFRYFVPKMKESKVLMQDDKGAKVRFKMELPFPFPNLWGVLDIKHNDQDKTFSWKLEEGNLKAFEGHSEVVRLSSGKSHLKLETHLRVGYLLPQSVVYWAAKRYLPKTLTKVNSRFRYEDYKRKKRGPTKRQQIERLMNPS